jgi:hypothetical protein
MNDMFDNLKELKQKLKTETASKQNVKKNQQNKTALNNKENILRAEFKEFMKKVNI